MKTQANVNVAPSGHIMAKGGIGPYARFLIQRVELSCIHGTYMHIRISNLLLFFFLMNLKKGGNVVTIQNTNNNQYLSMSESGKVQCVDSASHEASHFRVVINRDEKKKGQEALWYAFEGLKSGKKLCVNDKGLVQSTDLRDEDMDRVNKTQTGCYFTVANTKARHFPFLEQGATMVMKEIGKNINERSQTREDELSKSKTTKSESPMKGRKMTFKEKQDFYNNGFVVIKNVVDQTVLNNALKYINRGIERGAHCEGLGQFGLWDCREACILDLYFQSHAYSLIQSLLG
ncbi:hypothetical protein RFI_04070 [Reticulomyxa filosa]|uniref:Uncharacterized protein n=1 Tax=Reticulomyxa filosa TaxID=46433 RepID=X6P490_RETFI|nr:hypothetical protein RFI_04070 [Reticulomyxa filosa]|eukprot:ETO33041.1 hypothetical protein RFI_04070 [Reticulomyxa filosa]